MKCQNQKCNDTAVQHITEIDNGTAVEFHVCEEHAKNLSKIRGGRPAKPPMLRVLNDPELRHALYDQDAREKVVAAMLPALCLALTDDRPEVRFHAALELMRFNDAAASVVGALRDALDDEDERVRIVAEAAIQHIEEMVRH